MPSSHLPVAPLQVLGTSTGIFLNCYRYKYVYPSWVLFTAPALAAEGPGRARAGGCDVSFPSEDRSRRASGAATCTGEMPKINPFISAGVKAGRSKHDTSAGSLLSLWGLATSPALLDTQSTGKPKDGFPTELPQKHRGWPGGAGSGFPHHPQTAWGHRPPPATSHPCSPG